MEGDDVTRQRNAYLTPLKSLVFATDFLKG